MLSVDIFNKAIHTSTPQVGSINLITENDTDILSTKTTSYIIAQDGDDLIEKYASAKLLKPGGSILSTSNRARLIIMPGNYIISSELTIDAEYVDIIGLGAIKLERGSIPAVILKTNTINIVANDVYVKGISVGILQFKIANNMPLQVIEDCVGMDSYSFGQGLIVSGTFINCIGGYSAFAYGGNASGTFINCTGYSYSFGYSGNASGIFINCTGGDFFSGSTASGTFINCIAGGASFGYLSSLTGKLYNCRLLLGAFGAITSPGLIRNSIDGNNNIVNG